MLIEMVEASLHSTVKHLLVLGKVKLLPCCLSQAIDFFGERACVVTWWPVCRLTLALVFFSSLFSSVIEFGGGLWEIIFAYSLRLLFDSDFVIYRPVEDKRLEIARLGLILKNLLTFQGSAIIITTCHWWTQIIIALAGTHLVYGFMCVNLLSCSRINRMWTNGCAVFTCPKMTFCQSESIFCHVRVRLNLLLNHVHIFHCVWVHPVLYLRYMPSSKRTLWLLEQIVVNYWLLWKSFLANEIYDTQ